LIECNNGLYTHPIHLYYKKNFLSAWRLCCKTIYTTDHGIITEIPFMDMNDVLKCQGYKLKQQGIPYIAEHAENYLASVGAFIIETNKGLSFVESAAPLTDLPQFMQQVNRRYACNQCGIRVNADKDDPKPEELKCTHCVGGIFIREAEIDIENNMRRILDKMDKIPKLNKPIINVDMQKQALSLP
jgi:DNA-directed RNA polymerase subunit RPC12/RpoP